MLSAQSKRPMDDSESGRAGISVGEGFDGFSIGEGYESAIEGVCERGRGGLE